MPLAGFYLLGGLGGSFPPKSHKMYYYSLDKLLEYQFIVKILFEVQINYMWET